MYTLTLLLVAAAFAGTAQTPCFQALNCTPQTTALCDESNNDPMLWNQIYYWDSVTELHDLADAPLDLKLCLLDPCGNAEVSFVLLLDLDHDGVRETALSSDNLLDAGRLLRNNAANPGYTGGDTVYFDRRPVMPNEKYRFTVQKTVSGDTLMVVLRWATEAQPDKYILPLLPYGNHKIMWKIQSGADVQECGGNIVLKDCKAPVVDCLSSLSVNLIQNAITLWATDFLKNTSDNYTPEQKIGFAIRKKGQGTGFPLNPDNAPQASVSFDCQEIGMQSIELWVRDISGNAAFCESIVFVQDPMSSCNFDPKQNMCITTECQTGDGVEEVQILVTGGNQNLPQVPILYPVANTDSNGCSNVPVIPIAGNYVIKPVKDDNPLNGVTTYDAILLFRHILGLQTLNNPYKMIAGDINRSNSLTTYDIVDLRKLILGIYSEFPNNTSWRFVPKSYIFPNPANPFADLPIPDSLSVNGQPSLDFIGMKVGDLNCSALANSLLDNDDRGLRFLELSDRQLAAGETVEVPLLLSEPAGWLGFQLALQADPARLVIESVEPGAFPGMDAQCLAQPQPGSVRASWMSARPLALPADERLFTLRLRALAPLRLHEALGLAPQTLRAEAYDSETKPENLQLVFSQQSIGNERFTVYAPVPNPTDAGAEIAVRLPEPGDARVEILDVNGKSVFAAQHSLGAGLQRMSVPAVALPQSGAYVWRVYDGSGHVRSGILIRR